MFRLALPTAALALGLLLGIAPAKAATTLYTGVLSPQDVQVFCGRVGKEMQIFTDGEYGCQSVKLRIACKASLDCVVVTHPLDPNLGSPIDAWLMQHGLMRAERRSTAVESD